MAKANGNKPPAKEEQQRQKPAYECRLGRIKATVWANEHETQGTWYSVVVSRSYRKDGGKGDWASAHSFGLDDLLVVSEVCRMAYHWIHQQRAKSGSGTSGETATNGGDEPIPF